VEITFTTRNVLLGASLLGLVGGILGCFALLRRQSLLGDALAHTALPGVCLAYLITQSKSPAPILGGAMLLGLLGALAILAIVRFSRIKEDTSIGIVLSVFFGLGIVLLTYIQHLPFGNQSGLDKYLFGQAATLLTEDVVAMAILGTVVLGVTFAFYKELKLLSFDADFGASLGFPMARLEVLLTLLLVTVVVVGLQTVGVVLIVATLITPAAAARQWTDRLGVMLLLAGGIGVVAGASGALLSSTIRALPTGPVIVLCSSTVLVLSLLLAPRRGLLWARLESLKLTRRVRRENLLKDLYRFGEQAGAPGEQPVPWSVLMGGRGQSGREVASLCRVLRRGGLLEITPQGARLTARGTLQAERVVRKHRLWEVYLTRRLELPKDHVHRDAEAMEHALSEEALQQIEALLGYPTVDPHGRAIPPARASA
jgi:manganese/zinc/iron transport system permease protein